MRKFYFYSFYSLYKRKGFCSMNILPVNDSQSFKALDFRNVSTSDRRFVQKEFKKLKELGERYDIQLTSTYMGVPDYSAIDIIVKPLKEHVNILKHMFAPKGNATFRIGCASVDDSLRGSLADSVCEAIRDLNKNLH